MRKIPTLKGREGEITSYGEGGGDRHKSAKRNMELYWEVSGVSQARGIITVTGG